MPLAGAPAVTQANAAAAPSTPSGGMAAALTVPAAAAPANSLLQRADDLLDMMTEAKGATATPANAAAAPALSLIHISEPTRPY